jgi:hypothetical protein
VRRSDQLKIRLAIAALLFAACAAAQSQTDDESRVIKQAMGWTRQHAFSVPGDRQKKLRFEGKERGPFDDWLRFVFDEQPFKRGWPCRVDVRGSCLWADEESGSLHLNISFVLVESVGLTHCDVWRGWYAKDLPEAKRFECSVRHPNIPKNTKGFVEK